VEKRRKKYKGAPKELLLEELEERGESLKNVEKYRERTFVKIVGKEERMVEIFRNPRYLDDFQKTELGVSRRPNITSMKLVAKPVRT
jgi:hypothetical protein